MALSSKQTGTATIADASESTTATVSAFTLARSVLFFSYSGGNNAPKHGAINAVKTDTTTLTWSRSDSSGAVTIEWQLLVFDSDMTVQELSWTITDAAEDDTISAVTRADSWIEPGGANELGNSFSDDDFFRLHFTSTTNVEAERDNGTSSAVVTGQVCEYSNADTQEQTDTYTAHTDTAKTSASFTAVTLTQSFIRVTGDEGGTELAFDDDLWSAKFASTTAVTYTRAANASMANTHDLFVCAITDGTSTEDGSHTNADADATDPITITSITTDQTAVILTSASIFSAHGIAAVTDDDPRDGFYGLVLDTSTQMTITRTASSGACTLEWHAIEWAAASGMLSFNLPLMTGGMDDMAGGMLY